MADLDPRTKMMMIICITGAAMLTDNIAFLGGLLAFDIGVMIAGKIAVARIRKQIIGSVGIVIFIFLLQMIFGQLMLGVMLAVRLLIIIMSALILLTGQPRDYLLAMVQCKMPYELAYMVILAFHFFPILREEALDVYYSIQLRGTELMKASFRRKLVAFKKMCIPILAGALDRARDTSIAMEARGFRAHKRRTYMRHLKMKKKDVAIIVAMPVLAALFLLGAHGVLSNVADEIERSFAAGPVEGYEATISMTGQESASISWSADSLYEGIVECDGKKYAATVEKISDSYYRYSAEIEELKQGARYEYSVGSTDDRSNMGSFKLDICDEDFAFLYIGDIQYQLRDRDYATWGEFMQKAYKDNIDASFGIFAGDMVEKAPDPMDWQAFLKNAEPVFSRIPMMTTVGNHETSKTPSVYLKMMSLPSNSPLGEETYSFDYGDCHFVSLNSCLFLEERKEEEGYNEDIKEINDWIAQDLNDSDATWKVVYMHHPMYPVADDGDKIYAELRDNWENLLVDAGVDIVLCGHQHTYMRTEKIKGITYIMSRSGEKESYYLEEGVSAPDYAEVIYEEDPVYVRFDAADGGMEIEAVNSNGETVDKYKLSK